MVRAYGWAFRHPIRKIYYNLTITVISALVALAVAGIEAVSMGSETFGLTGAAWRWIDSLNDHWEAIGIIVILLFVLCWGVSMLIYRGRGYQELELVVVPARRPDA